ncbi:MAG: hypothetical protein IPK16_17305 [Anaerolineales bacterium]|nr:hypothetical protein [Anaerolineales bacterium]
MIRALCCWCGIETNAATAAALSALLAREMRQRHTAPWSRTLLLIMELLQNRRHDSVAAAGRLLLRVDAIAAIEGAGFTPRGLRLAYALAAYGQDPDDLTLIALYERAERCSFARYSLALPPDDADGGAQRPSDALASSFNRATVDAALHEFEANSGGGGRSLCLRVLQEPDAGFLVFANRVLREVGIHELDSTAFTDEAELLVLKFSPDLAQLEAHSTRRIGAKIGETIASKLLGQPVVYVDSAVINPDAVVRRLVDRLQSDSTSALELTEVQLRQAPIAGSPALTLRSQDGRSLNRALTAFSDCGIELLSDLDNIRSLSVSFRATHGDTAPHQFKLRLLRTTGGIHVQYTSAQTARRTRPQFEEHLKQTYGIAATPAAF